MLHYAELLQKNNIAYRAVSWTFPCCNASAAYSTMLQRYAKLQIVL